MLNITFTNANGDGIDMASRFPFVIDKYDGLGRTDATLQTTQGFAQNGAYYYGTLNNQRIINLSVIFEASSMIEVAQKKKTLANIFNPRLGLGLLTVEDETGIYKIDAAVAVAPDPYKVDNGIYVYRQFDVVFQCPKPDWLSLASTQVLMTGFIGGLTFPKTYPITYAERGAAKTITYIGDNPAQVLLDFRVESGGSTVLNPIVTKATGEYIELETSITAGQKILIDTNPDAPSIVLVDTDGTESDAWDTLVFGSTFFQLDVGDNTISFSSDSGDPELYLTYNEHYAGI